MAMEDLGKHDVGLLARAALDAPNPWLRARFADLAITTDGRTPPDWRLGQLAVNSYLEYTLLELACLRTQRNRVRKDGTRFLDVIPPGTPGRLLSEEVRDYLSDMRRRKLKPNTIEKTERTLAILKMVSGDIEVARIDYKHMLRMWELLRWAPSNLASDPTLTAVGRCPHCVGNGFGKEGTKR